MARSFGLRIFIHHRLLLYIAGIACLIGAHAVQTASGQAPDRKFIRGISLQGYPAGFIGTGKFTYFYRSDQSATLYLGLNVTDRRDWGRHDDESGIGAGAGLAWRRYFDEDGLGWFLGVRTDLWFMQIDWEENSGASGTTDIVVFQPTAQVGYSFLPEGSRWVFEASAALGAEINLQTDGEPVGEGAIFLLGLGAGFRF